MEFVWSLESFDVQRLTATVSCSESGFDADDFLQDANQIQVLALNHNAYSGTVSTAEDLSSLSIEVYFKEEGNLKKFCNEFVALQKEEDHSESK